MPCTPISARRSLTSSSLNGLMMASTFFIPGSLAHAVFRGGFRAEKNKIAPAPNAPIVLLPKLGAEGFDPARELFELVRVILLIRGEVVPFLVVARAVLL